MLTTLKSFLGASKVDITAIVSPLAGIVASLDAYLAKAKEENDADRIIQVAASDRISSRSKDITKAAEIRSNISAITGGLV